jgi:hypothetical protein
LGLQHRVERRGLLDDAGEQGGLAEVELGGGDAEVVLGRSLDAVGLVAVVHEVEVALENLLLGEVLLDVQGVLEFLELAGVGLLDRSGGGILVPVAQRAVLQRDLDVLLREGRRSLGVAALEVGDHGPAEAAHVEAVVLVEARVLDGQLRVLHVLRDLRQRHDDAVLVVRVGDHLAVGVEDARLLRQRRDRELARQVVEDPDATLGHLTGGPDRRDRQPSHQQPGNRAEHDETEKQSEHSGYIVGATVHTIRVTRGCRRPSLARVAPVGRRRRLSIDQT